jgi:hypothetical protein
MYVLRLLVVESLLKTCSRKPAATQRLLSTIILRHNNHGTVNAMQRAAAVERQPCMAASVYSAIEPGILSLKGTERLRVELRATAVAPSPTQTLSQVVAVSSGWMISVALQQPCL